LCCDVVGATGVGEQPTRSKTITTSRIKDFFHEAPLYNIPHLGVDIFIKNPPVITLLYSNYPSPLVYLVLEIK
jgi:hypothetical protein